MKKKKENEMSEVLNFISANVFEILFFCAVAVVNFGCYKVAKNLDSIHSDFEIKNKLAESKRKNRGARWDI